MPTDSSRTTVYLHIGPPKSGTTFLQGVLRYWRDDLHRAGVLFPAAPSPDHFKAAIDLRGRPSFGIGAGSQRAVQGSEGAWRRLVDATLAHRGTVVISHELFASADAGHAAQARADLAATDLHIVLTVRDPARQLVSAWQERIKHGSTRKFRTVAKQLRDDETRTNAMQDLPRVLDNWTAGVDPGHVHCVTVPPRGSDPQLLWERFAGVIGVDPGAFDPRRAPRSNVSLGVAELEVLRVVNKALDGRIRHPAYLRIVSGFFAQDILAPASRSPKPSLPTRLRDEVDVLADGWVSRIKLGGFDVRGDLDDLRPRYDDNDGDPEEIDPVAVAAAATTATADVLAAMAEQPIFRRPLRRIVQQAVDRARFAITAPARRWRGRRSQTSRECPEPPHTRLFSHQITMKGK